MLLADCVAQSSGPFIVRNEKDGALSRLKGSSDYSQSVVQCPLRYVLSDELTHLCADLAYSKGARTVTCADLLRVPARTLWIEWCNEPWHRALERHGFPSVEDGFQGIGRRGAFIHASPDGRRGMLRTFWTLGRDPQVLASAMEAYFDFDTPEGESPEAPDGYEGGLGQVYDGARAGNDILGRCFRFRYEASWDRYYAQSAISTEKAEAIWHHALGTIAIDVPMLLAFLLLLGTRTGLPHQTRSVQRLNRQRLRARKAPLLDHIEVRSPILAEYRDGGSASPSHRPRQRARLHHVRGHLVRRGNQIFWRVPHLRGTARSRPIQSRTVIWTFDEKAHTPAAAATAQRQ